MNPAPVLPEKSRRTLTCIGAGCPDPSVTLYLALPIAALFLRTTPDLFFSSLSNPQVMSALWLSLFTSVISLAIVILVGTPFAYVHTRCTYPGKVIVDTLIDLPLVLPPAVAGVALLVLYGTGWSARAVLQHVRDLHRVHDTRRHHGPDLRRIPVLPAAGQIPLRAV